MLTLITGTPGAGKTAWTVQELTRLPAQRKVYVHGIPELKLAHERIYCRSDLCDLCHDEPPETYFDEEGQEHEVPRFYVEEWPEWATDGSLIVIDEVQRIWRPTNSASKLSDDISRLETHRHRGLDFWLISQGPHLFHNNIRLLIGRHIHLVDKWNGRSEYEWPECRQNVTSRGDAVTRPYSLPKKIFHLYKSSSLHVKTNHRKPLAFYGLIACIFLLVGSVYITYQRVTGHMEKPATGASTSQPTKGGGGVGVSGGAIATTAAGLVPSQNKAKAEFPDFEPTIPGVSESAPAYQPLLKVKAVPLLSGCVYSQKKDKCTCYTQQATPYPASREYCMETVKNHRFNPYLAAKITSQPERTEQPEQIASVE